MTSPEQVLGRTEKRISYVILLAILAVGGGVFWKQYYFNPAVLLVQLARPAAKTGQQGTDRAVRVPTTLKEHGPLEQFSPDNLYDKIDGKAELYLAAGFSGMHCRRYALKENAEEWLEWFVYEMKGGPQAFSVFSTQRRAEGQPLDFTEYAYKTPNALFFVSGSNYVEVVAASASEPLMNAALEMAKGFVEGSASTSPAMTEMTLLPAENLVPSSQALQTSDAFGFDQFKNVYTAQYKISGAELMAFVSSNKDAAAATALRDAYRAFLIANGGKELETPSEFGKPIEIMGTVEVVFSHGRFVGGVHAAPSVTVAEQLARSLKGRLEGK